MTRPPWWRPFARRRWDRWRAAQPSMTTASMDAALKPYVEAIVQQADSEGPWMRMMKNGDTVRIVGPKRKAES